MARYYSVRVGKVPGVYRTWREAQAQTNRFPGAIHASFAFLTDAITWSGVPINRQPRWVQSEMGVPAAAPVSPGPNPSIIPVAPAAGPPVGAPPPYSSVAEATATPHTGTTATDSSTDNPPPGSSAPMQAPSTPQNGALLITLGSSASSNSLSDDEYGLEDMTFEEIIAAKSAIGLFPPYPASQCATNQDTRLPSHQVERQSHSVRGNNSGHTLPRANDHEDDVGAPELYPLLGSPPPASRIALQATPTQPDYSEWSATYHPGWVQDSLLSDIFHPPAPTGTSDQVMPGQGADRNSDSDDDWVDPFAPLPGGLFGAQDQHPTRFQVNLRTGSPTAGFYSPALSFLLGRHTVNYMFMHYFSPGSTTVVANTYLRNSANATAFIEELTAVGLPPRQAAYIWSIIRPEMLDPSVLLTSSEVQVAGGNTASESSEGEQEDAGDSSDSGYGTVEPNPAYDAIVSADEVDAIEYADDGEDRMDVDESPNDIPDPNDVLRDAYVG
ncbi:hypothetical protein M407DRAFT_26531 [Tulasnella calospora MUT 4182]|uniref:Ribonuclease H1 N-terminal domain-containing protein n=1 Tax=Tulasnella calospora MUT 4182 TaxID=1051891 RepID=A0A0C3QFM0_9AGAM|nr:hypothetical protein M407DRAFT_26531 [Tulasnella calospora MUT 4182]